MERAQKEEEKESQIRWVLSLLAPTNDEEEELERGQDEDRLKLKKRSKHDNLPSMKANKMKPRNDRKAHSRFKFQKTNKEETVPSNDNNRKGKLCVTEKNAQVSPPSVVVAMEQEEELVPSLEITPTAERGKQMERDKRDLGEKRRRVRRQVRRQVAAATMTKPGENPTAKPVDNSPTNSDQRQQQYPESPFQNTKQFDNSTDSVGPHTPGAFAVDGLDPSDNYDDDDDENVFATSDADHRSDDDDYDDDNYDYSDNHDYNDSWVESPSVDNEVANDTVHPNHGSSDTLLLEAVQVDEQAQAAKYRAFAQQTIREQIQSEAVKATEVRLSSIRRLQKGGTRLLTRQNCCKAVTILVAATVVGILLSLLLQSLRTNEMDQETDPYVVYLREGLLRQSVSTRKQLYDETSSQYKAVTWLAFDDEYSASILNFNWNNTNETDTAITATEELLPTEIVDRYVLAVLFFATNGDNWTYNEFFLLHNESMCEWQFITCDSRNVSITHIAIGTMEGRNEGITIGACLL